jgi:rod shape-determining protein MreD
MAIRRAVLCVVLLVLAVLIEFTMLSPLQFPGATPPLVLVVVVILAGQFGASAGAACGFAGGLLLNLAPPAVGTIGVSALLLTTVGFAIGRFAEADERPWPFTVVIAALAAPLVILGGAIIGGLLGDPRVRWEDVIGLMGSAAIYAAALALLLTFPLNALCRRVAPQVYAR